MPRERVTMRKIREILRLVWSCNLSRRDAARTCSVGNTHMMAGVIGMAVENFCLQATEEGLGTCILGWFDEKGVQRLLADG